MARQLAKLSALQFSRLTKPGLYGDGGGLTLQITRAGSIKNLKIDRII
jgi:hypothetical protein